VRSDRSGNGKSQDILSYPKKEIKPYPGPAFFCYSGFGQGDQTGIHGIRIKGEEMT
jgi:hypothetical protein